MTTFCRLEEVDQLGIDINLVIKVRLMMIRTMKDSG